MLHKAQARQFITHLCLDYGINVQDADLQLIVAGASGRVIMRVLQQGQPSGVLGVFWTSDRADNHSFVPAAIGLARSGVRVPGIKCCRSLPNGYGVCLVEDVGPRELLSLKGASFSTLRPFYASALEQVHALHSLTPDWELQPAFDASMYRWEQSYFAEHLLGRHCGLSCTDSSVLPGTAQLAEFLANLPRVPVHRDFQSQNIMLRGDDAWLIDFQGMRYGRAEYDVASLAYDPYMDLAEEQSDCLLREYERISGNVVDADVYYACALQRLMQALGAFSNIGYNQNREWYLSLIPTGVRKLRQVAARVSVGSPAYDLAIWLLNHI